MKSPLVVLFIAAISQTVVAKVDNMVVCFANAPAGCSVNRVLREKEGTSRRLDDNSAPATMMCGDYCANFSNDFCMEFMCDEPTMGEICDEKYDDNGNKIETLIDKAIAHAVEISCLTAEDLTCFCVDQAKARSP